MTPEEIASMHSDLILADLDLAADDLVEALKTMEETGADNTPPLARNAAQQAAEDDRDQAMEELFIQLATLLHDRHGLHVRFDIDSVSL